MKSRKKIFILAESVLAILVIMLAFVMIGDKRGESLGKVSVIVRNPDDNKWSAFKHGLKMAAQDYKIDLMIVSTGDMQTAEDEKRIIEQEMKKGVDAVIVEPIPRTGTMGMLRKLEKDIPILLIGQGMPENKEEEQFPVTEPSQSQMGKALAEEILKDNNRDLNGKTIGIVSETTDSKSAVQRIDGLRAHLEEAGGKILWSVSGDFGEVEGEFLSAQPGVDVIAAMDDNSLTMAGKYVSSKETFDARLYGIGNSSESIYYLDMEIAECLVVPDEFNVGYQSLTEIAESFLHSSSELTGRDISYRSIRQGELFSGKNQQILFNVSQ